MTIKTVAQNKKATHDFHIENTYEAGIELTGTEVKSIRAGKLQLKDSFAKIENGQVKLYGVHISPYDQGNIFNHEPERVRKLLLNKKEILKLSQEVKESGYSLIPLKVYFKGGWAKIEIALAKGKKNYDKREALKKKDSQRDIQRALKERSKA